MQFLMESSEEEEREGERRGCSFHGMISPERSKRENKNSKKPSGRIKKREENKQKH